MILSLLLAVMAFVAALPLLAPLMRANRPVLGRASYDQAVYRDQLQELDRDIARGLLTDAEAESARLEIQRRLLAADRQPDARTRLARSPVLAAIIFVFVTGGAIASYLWLGAPGVPDEPFSSRKAELANANADMSLRKAADQLAAKLKQNPSDADGWLLYGRSLAELGDWDKAVDAYGRAIALGRTDPAIVAAHAEMLVLQAGGTVTPAAETAFKDLLKTDPRNPVARYYLAVALMQAGEPKQAIGGFQALLAELPSDSPMRGQIGQAVTQAAQQAGIPTPALAQGTAPAPGSPDAAGTNAPGPNAPGPDAAAMANAANMTEQQRMTMIRGMVAKLAAEQQANPSNLDGWLRLGRAYAVLKEPDKAADAYDRAAALKPGDSSILLQEAQALLSNHDPTARLTPRTLALLQRIQSVDPNEPVVLWYLGLNAAQNAQPSQAREYWSVLLAHIPAASPDAKMVQQALDALPKDAPAPAK
ncbi:MAG TPA: c-type cytochrome biogenesis protein CcmI [Rhodopila sp.]|nr:c-type cytochrome biogenesis protein CcmI [Rhodopila sp.]